MKLMWAWFSVSALLTGIYLGTVLGGDAGFSGGAFVGGVIGGAVAAVPVMVIVDLLVKFLHTSRVSLAISGRERNRSVAGAREASVVYVAPASPPQPLDRVPPSGDRVPATDGGLGTGRSPSEDALIASLLQNPQLVAEAKAWKSQGYGRDVVAGVLTRKALELGLGNVSITADDLAHNSL